MPYLRGIQEKSILRCPIHLLTLAPLINSTDTSHELRGELNRPVKALGSKQLVFQR